MNVTHILVPVDDSKTAERAVDRAAELAAAFAAKITLLHAWEPLYAFGPIVGGAMITTETGNMPLAQHVSESAKRTLDHQHGRLKSLPLSVVPRLVEGSAKVAIRDALEEGTFDLVVMGTHGRTGLARMALGSVAEWVVRHSKIPVMTVRSQALAS